MAKRLTDYVMKNNLIDVSVQKPVSGIPGFPGCLEHGQMIWDTIKAVKATGGDVDVIWLDLANAYGGGTLWA